MKKCPYCAEEIQEEAIKCKHCGTDLLSELPKKKIKAKAHTSYWTFTLFSLFFPIIGVVLGIVYLTKKDPLDRKLGEHAITFSILAFILWSIILGILGIY